MYRQKLTESPKRKKLIIETLLSVQHKNYPRVKIHSEHVSMLCGKLSRMLELSENDTETMRRAGLYHDLGKIAMDQTILEKPSSLNEHEWYDVKRHSEVGYNILRSVPEYYDIAETVLHHHDRRDLEGTTFPCIHGCSVFAMPTMRWLEQSPMLPLKENRRHCRKS